MRRRRDAVIESRLGLARLPGGERDDAAAAAAAGGRGWGRVGRVLGVLVHGGLKHAHLLVDAVRQVLGLARALKGR